MKTIHLFLLSILFLTLSSCNKAEQPEQPGKEKEEQQEKEKEEEKEKEKEKEHSWAFAAEINKRLGRGMNIGNTFEAMPTWQSKFDKQDLKRIADLGFTHVRLPIRWERDDRSMDTAPYTIRPEFLKTIQSVIDEALHNKLHIIINMHHHDALYANPAGQKNRFLSQWQQISDYFKDYPDSLLFEIMNEPHDNLTTSLWNEYSNEALQTIRKNNPERCVLLGAAEWGGIDALKSLHIPNDSHLILTIHYYSPFSFTHQGAEWVDGSDAWLGTKWRDTEYERNEIKQDFKLVKQIAKEKNIPVHIGELGAFSKADMHSRVLWTQYIVRWLEQQDFSWAYWEWNASFGIYDPKTGTYRTELVDALLKNPIPEPFKPSNKAIYSSNFTNNNDGWTIYNNHTSASATVNFEENKAKVAITKTGTAAWHIQLIKNGFDLQKGKTYMLRFNAFSPNSDSKEIRLDFSKATDPWTSYAEKAFTLDKKDAPYEMIFTPPLSDPQTRVVFSMGNSGTSGVTLHNVELFEIKF